jgi:hypothetical protein
MFWPVFVCVYVCVVLGIKPKEISWLEILNLYFKINDIVLNNLFQLKHLFKKVFCCRKPRTDLDLKDFSAQDADNPITLPLQWCWVDVDGSECETYWSHICSTCCWAITITTFGWVFPFVSLCYKIKGKKRGRDSDIFLQVFGDPECGILRSWSESLHPAYPNSENEDSDDSYFLFNTTQPFMNRDIVKTGFGWCGINNRD